MSASTVLRLEYVTLPELAPRSTPSKPQAIRARNSVMVVFALNGFIFASWMSRVPDIQEVLNLTPWQLSLLVLATSLGAICGLPTAGAILGRIGAARSVLLGVAIAVPGIVVATLAIPNGWPMHIMLGGLFLYGIGTGIWDVSQNLEGTHVEQRLGRSIMPWFHAGFSAGSVVGALIGAFLVSIQFPILPHLLIVTALIVCAVLIAVRPFLPAVPASRQPGGHRSGASRQRSAWTEPRTLLIGVVVLAAAFAEGTANDWMAVAFVNGHGLEKSLGVVATAVFLTFMTAGRIVGTRLLDLYGRVVVLRVSFICAILGSLLVVFGSPLLAFIGAAVWGLGASLGFPVGMSAAADDPSRAHSRLSVVSTIGYGAFLGGPPLLGFLGEHVGLLNSFVVVGCVSLLALLIVPFTRPLDASKSAPMTAEHPQA